MPTPKRKNSFVRALKRSVTQSTNEVTVDKPKIRKSSSLNTLSDARSDDNIDKALNALKKDLPLRLNAQECLELQEKLREYAEPAPINILRTSLEVYEAYKLRVDALVNFHAQTEYQKLMFCYIEDCSTTETATTAYIKCLTLTDYSGAYAVFRLIKFCPLCFDRYFAAQLKQPDDPLLVRINERAYKLFSVLSLR